MTDSELLHEIKECLVGTEFNRKGCVLDRLDKLDNKIGITQNQVNTLMQDREKNKNKLTITIPKWITVLIGMKVKTGL